MPQLSGIRPAPRTQIQSVRARVAQLAERQWGVVSRGQLIRLGIGGASISRRPATGLLHRLHPGIYAFGHRAVQMRGRLAAALLFAGPGGALSHQTAAWWWGLLRSEHRASRRAGLGETPPRRIHVSATGYRRSIAEVRIHHPRRLERTSHRGMPITTVARTLLDVAATLAYADLRRALAEADYRKLLDLDAVERELGRGHAGSAALRRALASHMPQLARGLSVLEERFLALCEAAGIPLPAVNPRVGGWMVDALWRRERLVVELDGHVAHGSAAAIERDRRRDLTLRASGYSVLRYTWGQITRDAERVAADLREALTKRH